MEVVDLQKKIINMKINIKKKTIYGKVLPFLKANVNVKVNANVNANVVKVNVNVKVNANVNVSKFISLD